MHKKIIALISTLTCFATTQAAEIYGTIELGLQTSYIHNPAAGNMQFVQVGKDSNGKPIYMSRRAGSQALSIDDYGSSLGIRGDEDLGNGIKLIYNLEWGFNAADGNEFGDGFKVHTSMLGLETDLGTLALGKMDSPLYGVIEHDSVAYDFYAMGFSASGAAAGEMYLGQQGSMNTFDSDVLEHVGNFILYTSPTIADFTFTAGIVANGENDLYRAKRNVDAYTLRLVYQQDSGFYTKLGFFSADIKDNDKRSYAYALQVGYRLDKWGVTGNYGASRNNGNGGFAEGNAHSVFFWDEVAAQTPAGITTRNKQRAQGWDLGAYWAFGPDNSTIVRGTFGQAVSKKRQSAFSNLANFSNKEDNRLRTFSIGLEQVLSPRTFLWFEYQHSQVKQKFATSGMNFNYVDGSLGRTKFKDHQLSLGIEHNF